MRFNLLRFTGILGLLFVLPGCYFSSNPEDLKAYTTPDLADVTMDQYIIQPPDQITVIASGIPELQGDGTELGQTQTIRPDGIISFEKLGEIHVAGKTPRQVAKIISEKLAPLYKLDNDYPVDVRVSDRDAENSSKMYFMLGMVSNPGAHPFSGRETTLSAIAKAIPTQLAWKKNIQVIRPSPEPSQPSKVFALNYQAMSERGQMGGNVLLQDGDIIYVPPTVMAAIGLKIGEFLNPILLSGSTRAMFVAD